MEKYTELSVKETQNITGGTGGGTFLKNFSAIKTTYSFGKWCADTVFGAMGYERR
ncbi:bacteriocin [Enterococcus faecium]|nr:bacteriocin [Enterococcus faecium]